MEAAAGQARRPLLGGGERLSAELERPGGGGEKSHPRTIEQAVAHLTPQYERLAQQASAIPSEKRGRRIIVEADVLPNYLSNSDFPRELFAETDLVPVGTRVTRGIYATPSKPSEERETKSYLLAGDERSIAYLGGVLRGEGRGARAQRARLSLRQFETLRVPGAQDTLRINGESTSSDLVTWEAVFHPVLDRNRTPVPADGDEIWQKWLDFVASLGGEVADRYVRSIGDLLFAPVRLPRESANEAASFNPLRTLRPMPSIRPVPVSPLRTVGGAAPAPPPGDRPASEIKVAVFDGGVDAEAPAFRPFVRSADLTAEPPDPSLVAHGSVVTAAILFGADHGARQELQTPEVGVDHFRVLPVARADAWDLDLYRILDQIVTQLRGGSHKIVNLSIGPNACLDDADEPHAWTAQLDALAEEEGILFLTAVGNDGTAAAEGGANRLQTPSDMVNGLGVGACDRRPPTGLWSRAPYSSVGPGRPGCRMQPAGLAFGGVDDDPFRAVGPGGVVMEANGTSLATPTAVHGLAALSAQIGTAASEPSVLRAFAAHFAEPPDGEDLHAEVGFGRMMERYDGILECQPNEVTILYRDQVERGEMRSLPFPLIGPEIGNHMVDLRWTIAFATAVDPKDSADYTQAGLDIAFRPHEQVRTYSKYGSRESGQVNVVTEAARAAQLIADGFTVSNIPKAAQSKRWRHETLRRQEDGKWETMHRSSARKRASSLHRPRVSALYLAREEGGLVEAEPLSLVMLLSISTAEGVPLYDSVRAAYPVLNPIRPHLPLRLTT